MKELFEICSVFILTLRIVKGQRVEQYQYLKGNINILCTEGTIYSIDKAISAIGCAKMCALHENCKSYFYKSFEKCQLQNVVIANTNSCASHPGTVYYIPRETATLTTTDTEIASTAALDTTQISTELTTETPTFTTTDKEITSTVELDTTQITTDAITTETSTLTTTDNEITSTLEHETTESTTEEPTTEISTVTLPQTTTSQPACADGWITIDSWCYKITPGGTQLNWEDALIHCNSIGGYLAVLETDEENTALKAYLTANGPNTDIFIGGSDLETEGLFKWNHTGEIVNLPASGFFEDWNRPNQPDNGDGLQHCMVLFAQGGFTWNDNKCPYAKPFICESEMV